MAKWTRRPQEVENDNYFFSGRAHMTRAVAEEVPMEEVLLIIADLKAFVENENGVDYLQVYVSDNGQKIFCIDQLSKSMKESGDYSSEDDVWTVMFAEDY